MKKLLIAMITTAFIACSDQSKKKADDESTQPKQDIFPVTSFVAEQVNQVDSLQPPIIKYTTQRKKTDTVLISTQEFKQLAKEFTEPDITDPSLNQFYRESSFADESIPSITFTYSTPDKNLEIQRLDVILEPSPVLNDKVKSIYLEKIMNQKDTSVMKKLYWRANKNFQIITSKQVGNEPPETTQLKVSWDNTE